MSTGDVVAFVAYVGALYMPLTLLTNSRVDLMTSFVSFERVFEVLDLPHAITDAPDAVPIEAPLGRIEFRDVHFRYPRANEVSLASLEMGGAFEEETTSGEVLHGVDFVAEPGMTVALVAPAGASDAHHGCFGTDTRAEDFAHARGGLGYCAAEPNCPRRQFGRDAGY